MATHFSILAWRILWTEEPGGLLSAGHKESDMIAHTQTHIYQNGINRDKGKYNITTAIRARESRIRKAHWFCGVMVFKALREDRNSPLQRTAWTSHRAWGRGG